MDTDRHIDWQIDWDDLAPALGTVVEQERGSLPFALVHGEALVAAAAWSLGEAGVTPIDLGTQWEGLVASGEPFVLHDSLCPMTPPAFIAECVARALATDHVVVGVRPVTDTVKRVASDADGDRVGGTLDREGLVSVCSPIVLPARVVADLADLPSLDFAVLVAGLRAAYDVDLVEAPAAARRVADLDGLRVLGALTGEGSR